MIVHEKLTHLKNILQDMGSVAVAYSSGVDSTFLLHVAKEVLGNRAIAITIRSRSFPEREYEEAVTYCEQLGVAHQVCQVNELEIPGFSENPPDRCYICKKALFREVMRVATAAGAAYVIEGSNVDDDGDYRPGHRAIKELGIRSPLREAMLTKAEIRLLSKERGLHTWDKPSFACLSSRFAYGETITEEKLRMVEQAENMLMNCGFSQLRVRMHGMMARIELLPEDMPKLWESDCRIRVTECMKKLGFTYVSVDLSGYRSGSMNEVLDDKIR